MNSHGASLNALWAGLIIDEFTRVGVHHFSLASGSRSSPLAVAIARHPSATANVHVDERGAAFYALGVARAIGTPAAVVTTSGTAAANLLPAAVEAAMDFVPLILLTADRPPELRDTHANQTIRQPGLFGRYVRWDTDLPCPEESVPAAFVLTTVDQAVHRAMASQGPVHVNAMFREPLAPDSDGADHTAWIEGVGARVKSDRPYTEYILPRLMPSTQAVADVERAIKEAKGGLVVVGALRDGSQRASVAAFVEKLGWPVFADITSGLRLARSASAVPYHDLVLLDTNLMRDVDVVLHLGGRIVSKRLAGRLREHRRKRLILVAEHAERQDPDHGVDLRIQCDPAFLCDALIDRIAGRGGARWLSSWAESNRRVEQVLASVLADPGDLSEPAVARHVVSGLSADWGLVLASSMPIRDVASFAAPRAQGPRLCANRGASGIDGTVATACGFAAGLRKPVAVLLGDLAMLHDLNSLQLVRRSAQPVILVVINNNGGGIFHFLPIAEHTDVFEPYFGTPHGLCFEHAAAMYGLGYVRPASGGEFVSRFAEARDRRESVLIEVVSDRRGNVEVHRRIEDRVRDALQPEAG